MSFIEPPLSVLEPFYGPEIVERATGLLDMSRAGLDDVWRECARLRDWEEAKAGRLPGYDDGLEAGYWCGFGAGDWL